MPNSAQAASATSVDPQALHILQTIFVYPSFCGRKAEMISHVTNGGDALAEVGVRAAFLKSTQTYEEASQIERQVRNGEIDLVYVAPRSVC